MNARTLERFMALVTFEPNTGCWLWMGATNKAGYGRFTLPGGVVEAAHIVAYLLLIGPVPEGRLLRHSCDTPGCVNAEVHLLPGTQKENIADALRRGRWPIGERHPRAILTEAGVRELRRIRLAGGSVSAAAREMGVSQSAASDAAIGKSWKHLA